MRSSVSKLSLPAAGLLITAALFTACGSGSEGSGSASGPAYVRVTANPAKLDTGDRTEVRVLLKDLQEDSIAVKIRFPVALNYVLDSSYYLIDDRIFDAGPEEDRSDSSYSYLVFYVDKSYFDWMETDSGLLIFELEGRDNVQEETIGVDVDYDDPLLDNSGEFDLATPKFDAQSESPIQVGPDPVTTSTSSGSSSK